MTKTANRKEEAQDELANNALADEYRQFLPELERIENVIRNCEVFEPDGFVLGPDLVRRRASDQEATTAKIELHNTSVEFSLHGDFWENAAREIEKRAEEFLEAAKRLRQFNPRAD